MKATLSSEEFKKAVIASIKESGVRLSEFNEEQKKAIICSYAAGLYIEMGL